jgi:hypothetical protein
MVATEEPNGGRSAQIFRGCAEIIAGWPTLRLALLAEHVRRPDGSCLACSSGSRRSTPWPCGLRALAELAEELAGDAARTPRGR